MHVYLSFMKKIAILLPFVFLLLALLTGCQKNPSLESNSSSTVDSPNQSGSSLPSQPIGPSQAAEPAALPMITADMLGLEGMDKALFDGAVAFLGRQTNDPEKMTIPYIGIFGQYESDGKINLICHVGLKHFAYNDDRTALIFDGAIIAYGKAVLTKEDDGAYTCISFTLAGDGAAEVKDLKEFCGPLTELPDEIYAGLDYTSTFPSHREMETLYAQATGLTIQ